MENLHYLIYVHAKCIEGICITKKNNNINISKEVYNFSNNKNKEKDKKTVLEKNFWLNPLKDFLDQQKWRDHPIAFLFPSEEIIFRKIRFPFQEKKKVEQALPFALEEELISNLSEITYSSKVQNISNQNSEALALLIESERLNQLKKICFDRDLLIRNVDCSAYALFRSNILRNPSKISDINFFQIYLGSDEAFVNTIKNGHLDDIKIFPNRISDILEKNLKKDNSLHSFLEKFSKNGDFKNQSDNDSKDIETFSQLKKEIQWLCSQFTLHLRIKNFNSESQIETYGIFGPFIKWDGIFFKQRSFPLPEAVTFSERYKNNSKNNNSFESKFNEEGSSFDEINGNTPNTLQELMEEAKQRENSDEKLFVSTNKKDINPSKKNLNNFSPGGNLESVNPKTSILSLVERKHWSILGDLRNHLEFLFEPHSLSLYYENTPWRLFLRRNKANITITFSFLIIIVISFIWQKVAKYHQLKNEVFNADLLMKNEIAKTLPKSSTKNVEKILIELREKINYRKNAIQISKKFEKREYENLQFLKNISTMLDENASFQVDSIELSPERFSVSGNIDSYERLQIFKKKLEEINFFHGKKIVESNRKSPNGIIYRILIELK